MGLCYLFVVIVQWFRSIELHTFFFVKKWLIFGFSQSELSYSLQGHVLSCPWAIAVFYPSILSTSSHGKPLTVQCAAQIWPLQGFSLTSMSKILTSIVVYTNTLWFLLVFYSVKSLLIHYMFILSLPPLECNLSEAEAIIILSMPRTS